MSINFYPHRKKMSREIGLCIVLERREVLESLCSSCIFQIFENTQVRECFACEVQQAMNVIGQNKKNMVPADPGYPECEAVSGSLPGRKEKESMADSGDFVGKLVNYSKALLLAAVLLCFFIFGSASASLAFAPAYAALSGPVSNGSTDVVTKIKILSVLKSRTSDRTVLDKAVDKLSTMEGRRLRLLSSLCDRISEDSENAGADIAFSLMTMLIVLS